jgi:hypothetical protein
VSESPARSAVVDLCCAILLTVGAARSYDVNRALVQGMGAARTRFAMVPANGSLANVAETSVTPTSADRPHVLLFVIHAKTVAKDVAYWNSVEQETRRRHLNVELVGVCDASDECGPKASAMFRTIRFLDPYQSHILATADHTGEALLYRGSVLIARLQSSNREPNVGAHEIADAVK